MKLSKEKFEDIKYDLKNIEKAADKKLYMYQNILTINFISKLGKQLKKEINNTDFAEKESREIVTALEYIKDNLSGKISITSIAKHANMSTATLNRRFKEILNVTPMEYVRFSRTNLAQKLINEKRYSKAEIAQMCGFYDSVHMNKTLSLQKKGKMLKNLALLNNI